MTSLRADIAKRHFRFEELFVALALEAAYPDRRIHLHPSEAAVELAPDVVVGRMSSPQIVASVTRLSAQNAVQVKAWRDVYELLLYRRLHPGARIFRVLFGSPGAASWNRALERVYDIHLFVRDLPGGLESERFLHGLTESAWDVPPDRTREVLLERMSAPVHGCLRELSKRLGETGRATRLEAPLPKDTRLTEPFFPTALRRTVTFLGLFPELVSDGRGRTSPGERQEWFERMGLVTTGGLLAAPWRDWVESAHAAVGRRAVARLAQTAHEPSRRIRTRLFQMQRTLEHFRSWFAELAACDDPARAVAARLRADEVQCAACGGHPILLALRNLLKLDGGDAFGNARILQLLGRGRDTSDLYRVSRWFSGAEPTDPTDPWENLWPWFELAAAKLTITSGPGVPSGLEPKLFAPLFFDEAMKNRQIEPLGQLLRETLGGAGTWQVRHPTFLDPSGAVGTVRCFRVKDTVFHWKTAHDGHRDKTKELAAKGVAMRIFAPKERFVLLTDGDFSEKDLGALAVCGGWDWVIPVSSWQKEGASIVRRL